MINQTSVKCAELLKNGLVDLIIVNYPNNYLGNTVSVVKIKRFQDRFIAGDAFDELRGRKLTFRQLIRYPILMLDKTVQQTNSCTSFFSSTSLIWFPRSN